MNSLKGNPNLDSEDLELHWCKRFLGRTKVEKIWHIQTDTTAFQTLNDSFQKIHESSELSDQGRAVATLYLCAILAMQLDSNGPYNQYLLLIIGDYTKMLTIPENKNLLTKKQHGLVFWILRQVIPYVPAIIRENRFLRERLESSRKPLPLTLFGKGSESLAHSADDLLSPREPTSDEEN